jgi:hypothetical protein
MDTENRGFPRGFPYGSLTITFSSFFIRACDSGRPEIASNSPEDVLTTVTDEIVRPIPLDPTPHYAKPSL